MQPQTLHKRLLSLHVFLVPIAAILISAFLWPQATLFWVVSLVAWITVVVLLLKWQNRVQNKEKAFLRRAVEEMDAEQDKDAVSQEQEEEKEKDAFWFDRVVWTFSYLPEFRLLLQWSQACPP